MRSWGSNSSPCSDKTGTSDYSSYLPSFPLKSLPLSCAGCLFDQIDFSPFFLFALYNVAAYIQVPLFIRFWLGTTKEGLGRRQNRKKLGNFLHFSIWGRLSGSNRASVDWQTCSLWIPASQYSTSFYKVPGLLQGHFFPVFLQHWTMQDLCTRACF